MFEKTISKVLFHPPPFQAAPGTFSVRSDCGHTCPMHYYSPANPRAVLLYSHGNGDNLAASLWLQRFAERWNCALLIYEYCGYSELSPGLPSEACCCANIECALRWLLSSWPPERVIVWGYSIGGGPSCYLASRYRVGGLLLQSTFTSIKAMAELMLGGLATLSGVFVKFGFPNANNLAKSQCPVMVVHGTMDNVVPFEHGLELAMLKQATCYFPPSDHINIFHDPGFEAAIHRWLNDIV